MGLFSSLFRSRDAPQNRTAGSGYTFFFGGTTSGKAVTERSAMQMTAGDPLLRRAEGAVRRERHGGLCRQGASGRQAGATGGRPAPHHQSGVQVICEGPGGVSAGTLRTCWR